MARRFQVTFDCAGPDALAHFWADALGYRLDDPPEGFATWEDALKALGVPEEEWDDGSAIIDLDKIGPRIYFQRVAEGKTVKNRVHLDLDVSAGPRTPIDEVKTVVGAEVERLTALGATRLREVQEGEHFHVVMQDPEGNEFCLR